MKPVLHFLDGHFLPLSLSPSLSPRIQYSVFSQKKLIFLKKIIYSFYYDTVLECLTILTPLIQKIRFDTICEDNLN